MTFASDNLPVGLTIDAKSGIITGQLAAPGTHVVLLKATNPLGTGFWELKIVVGEQIALTPPMGWNSWNCWAQNVSDKNVRSSAKAMVDSGLVNHGWTYINIDDTWQGARGGEFNAIEANKKFPDMKELCDYIEKMPGK
jgi:alpha-galactosidase